MEPQTESLVKTAPKTPEKAAGRAPQKSPERTPEAEEVFRLLVDAVDEYAIFALSPTGVILTWNQGGQRLKGYEAKDVIGTHFSRFYTAVDINRNHPAHELELAAKNGKYEEEGWRIKKDGSQFWANVVITALRDSEGRLKGFGKVTRDLTQRRQAEIAIRESEERFRLLVTNVTDYAIITLDTDGHVTSWNSGAAKITGYASKEILGSHVSKFYTPEDIQTKKIEKELRTATETGRYEEEGLRVRKDGTVYWANVVITAIKDEVGKVVGFSKVTRDITASRKAEQLLRESEERFRLMVESVQDYAIFMLDPKGRVATWNRGAERNKGYTAAEIIDQHFSIFYPEADVKSGKPDFELREALKNGRFEHEGWRVRKDGSLFWANIIISPFYDKTNTLLGFSQVTRNLTERKKAEDALREAYNDLEKRIELRTKELSVAKAKAEAAVKIRENFFSMASHELKTPLSSLKMQAQLRKRNVLRGNLNDFKPENLLELCSDDERQIDRLSFLVDNMLDISKLTSGALALVLEPLSLNEVVTDVVVRLRPILEQSGNTCVVTSETNVHGTWDRHRLEQVFTNLLSNAGKYAPGKPVEVHVSQADGVAKVSVKDYGRGISEQDQTRIFKAYERINDNGQTSGLGLGLFITKQIVEAHQGDLMVQSHHDNGTTFVVELPIKSQPLESHPS